MSWIEIVGMIIGAGGFVAIIDLLKDRLKRKDTVKDKADGTADQLEELRAETSEQFQQVDGRITAVEQKIDTLAEKTVAVALSTKAQAYDRIRHLGLQYIKVGFISDEELRNLTDMHEAYHALGGDGFLDKVMDEVYKLRIKPSF